MQARSPAAMRRVGVVLTPENRKEEGLVHMALARRGAPTFHREAHFGPKGRGAIRVQSLKAMLEMLEQALEQE